MKEKETLQVGSMCRGNRYTYKIEQVLGQGSFGITYLATTELVGDMGRLPVRVALKEFYAKGINSRDSDGRGQEASADSLVGRYGRAFQKEAMNLSHLSHPGIVRVLEAFEANNTWYYAMEYIDGGSLDEYVTKQNGLAEPEALAAIREIGSALSFMHEHKMLHLDLKPKNIMRRKDGHLVLIDFGLSKQFSANGEAESSTTIGLGTPGYAPLEQSQLGSGSFFASTLDIYALAATLFKMLTGKTPPTSSEVFNFGFPGDELRSRGIGDNTIVAIEAGMAPQQRLRPQSVADFLKLLDDGSSVIDDEQTIINSPLEIEESTLLTEEIHDKSMPSTEHQESKTSIPDDVRVFHPFVRFSLWLAALLSFIALILTTLYSDSIGFGQVGLVLIGIILAFTGVISIANHRRWGFWLFCAGGFAVAIGAVFSTDGLIFTIALAIIIIAVARAILIIKNKHGLSAWDTLH